jgi:hypothetical protein
VLSILPAFILSQDQTLKKYAEVGETPKATI